MRKQPALFVSHGSPMIVIDDSPARTFLAGLAGELAVRPDAIVLFSAHHDERVATITSGAMPETIHDFGGFPTALYEMRYPAPGRPELAGHVAELLDAAGIANRLDAQREFDHGAWTPLMLAWPNADIPIVQVSIDTGQSPEYHYRLGQALAPLREENILLVGSGSMTHNLRAFFRGGFPATAPVEGWVADFLGWLDDRLEAGDTYAALHLLDQAPHGHDNHPTSEHILPLFVALGAGSDTPKATKLHASVDHGVLAMDAWRFD
jgi:4,5-DOPA dioxygenase extradiol